jgi:hypothetical protein
MKLDPGINLDRYLEGSRRIRNRIYRIGVELEGAWEKLPRGTQLTRDGSLDPLQNRLADGFMGPDGKVVGYKVGELPSPPLELGSWETWMRTFYPHRVGPECGLHVHMSFVSAFTYMRVMRPNYPSTVLDYVTQWAKKEGLDPAHPLWPRLEGKSRYCQHKFFADSQVATPSKDFNQDRDGHRYTVINYPFVRNQTVECRLRPMFATVEQAISAIQNLLNVTNAYLVATASREPKIQQKVELNSPEVRTATADHTVVDGPTAFREVRHARV